jgi:hypothetical protein
MTDKSLLYIEEKILNSVKKLLTGRVNELLGETEYPIPPVEFGNYRGGSTEYQGENGHGRELS